MTLALILFAFTYCLMLALPRFRPFAEPGPFCFWGSWAVLSGLFLITNCSLTKNPPRDRHF